MSFEDRECERGVGDLYRKCVELKKYADLLPSKHKQAYDHLIGLVSSHLIVSKEFYSVLVKEIVDQLEYLRNSYKIVEQVKTTTSLALEEIVKIEEEEE